MPMARAAAEIDPVSRTLSSSAALPGPIRAPESKIREILMRAIVPIISPMTRLAEVAACRNGPKVLWSPPAPRIFAPMSPSPLITSRFLVLRAGDYSWLCRHVQPHYNWTGGPPRHTRRLSIQARPMESGSTTVGGIVIPSTDPTFLAVVVGLHIPLGIACVVTGASAMLSQKGRGRHFKFGTNYFW